MRKITILYAFLLALLAMVVSYVSTNIKVPFFGERDVLKYWSAFSSYVSDRLSKNKTRTDSAALFIDVSADNQLIDIRDTLNFPVGNAVITDRNKLVELLTLIKSSGNYTYVLLDVFFEDGYASEADSVLFDLISSMDRIVIPKHEDGILASSAPAEKAAYASYRTNLKEDDFAKYPILDKNGMSLPLKMYSDITGRVVQKHGFLYLDGAKVARRTIFPKIYVQTGKKLDRSKEKSSSIDKPLNMGFNILSIVPEAEMFENKIVVIGNFDTDVHRTYAGDIPGPVILYNVFKALREGKHIIPFWLLMIYFCIFFVMSLLLLKGAPDKTQSLGWLWAKLFVIYSVVLTIVCIFVFETCGQVHDIFITSTMFSLIDTCHTAIIKKKKNA